MQGGFLPTHARYMQVHTITGGNNTTNKLELEKNTKRQIILNNTPTIKRQKWHFWEKCHQSFSDKNFLKQT